jgi:hypothetical protein
LLKESLAEQNQVVSVDRLISRGQEVFWVAPMNEGHGFSP